MNPSLSNPNYNLQVQGFQTPTVPTTMNATSLQTPTNVNLTPATPTTPVPNIQNIPTDTATPTQTNVTTQTTPANPLDQTSSAWKQAFDKVTGLFSSKQNQASDLATATQTAEAPYQQQLNEVNTQIKMQQANAISNQEKAANAGETSGYASREQQNIARTDAIETLKLSAIQAGLQGNIALAETQATNAINAKYSQINQDIENAKTAIYDNFDNFSSSEKKKAEATLLRLDSNDFFAKSQMENEKAVSAVIQTAIKQGQENGNPVPTLILTQATKLVDPTEATALLAPYLKDAGAIQAKIDVHNNAIANQAKIYQDMAINKEELKIKQAAQVANTVIDPVTKQPTSELKLNAREAASALLNRVQTGNGTSAVGGSRVLGLQYVPGTNASDFKVQFDNLKSILSLDNVKLLKGQGAVSDSERALLAAASANLNLSQSDTEFKKNLVKISIGLGNPQEVTLTDTKGKSQKVIVDADTLNQAISDGLKVTY